MTEELNGWAEGDVHVAMAELEQLQAAVSGLMERTTVADYSPTAEPENADPVVQEATLHRSG